MRLSYLTAIAVLYSSVAAKDDAANSTVVAKENPVNTTSTAVQHPTNTTVTAKDDSSNTTVDAKNEPWNDYTPLKTITWRNETGENNKPWTKAPGRPFIHLESGIFGANELVKGIYNFKNIPYARAPTGKLRWARPQKVPYQGTVVPYLHEPSCHEIPTEAGFSIKTGPNRNAYKNLLADLLETAIPFDHVHDPEATENCLKLDVQVPKVALRFPREKLPVVVFIYGGSFLRGRKDNNVLPFDLYDGRALLKASMNKAIYVTFNYRTGAFGFLGGKTMEEQATPNVGLWDQRAVFQWVQDNIAAFGGDPGNVTAMGHSAGAASIIAHLTAQHGTLDPLFHRAIILSPAMRASWDRNVTAEETYKRFEEMAGCKDQGIKCLQAADESVLQKANIAVAAERFAGDFPFGPTTDDEFMLDLPSTELAKGTFWPLDGLILSHTAKETRGLIPAWIETDENFEQWLRMVTPNHVLDRGYLDQIVAVYPNVSSFHSPYKKQAKRVEQMLAESCFTCYNRWLMEAYGPEKVWMMRFDDFGGWHGADLALMFGNFDFRGEGGFRHKFLTGSKFFLHKMLAPTHGTNYRSYMASFIRTGNPNTLRDRVWPDIAMFWRHPGFVPSSNYLSNVLRVKYRVFYGMKHKSILDMPRDHCEFWKSFYYYAPREMRTERDLELHHNRTKFAHGLIDPEKSPKHVDDSRGGWEYPVKDLPKPSKNNRTTARSEDVIPYNQTDAIVLDNDDGQAPGFLSKNETNERAKKVNATLPRIQGFTTYWAPGETPKTIAGGFVETLEPAGLHPVTLA